MPQHSEQGAERHTVGNFAAVRRTSLLRQQAYLITWYAVFVCSFVLRLVGHGILFEGFAKLVLSLYRLAPGILTFVFLEIIPPHYPRTESNTTMESLDAFVNCARACTILPSRLNCATVSFSSSKGTLVRLMWLASCMVVPRRLPWSERKDKTKKIERSRGKAEADVTILNKTREKNVCVEWTRFSTFAAWFSKKESFISSCT